MVFIKINQYSHGVCRWRRSLSKNSIVQKEKEIFLIKLNLECAYTNFKRFKNIARSKNISQRSKSSYQLIQSANVFLTKSGIAKLGDMNVSKIAKNGLLYTQTGTPYYASPEVWKDKPYDSKSDIWSFGCVIY